MSDFDAAQDATADFALGTVWDLLDGKPWRWRTWQIRADYSRRGGWPDGVVARFVPITASKLIDPEEQS